MKPFILDGKKLSQIVQQDVRRRVDELSANGKRIPGLGVVLVGDNPASRTYVANKERFAERAGFHTVQMTLPKEASFEEVAAAITDLNQRSDIDGILLQLPLPRHLDSARLLDMIDPHKDADGLHPLNQGLLLKGTAYARPCTPLGVIRMLDYFYDSNRSDDTAPAPADLSGKVAIVVGRSILVGKPLGLMLLERNATVITAHSKTRDIESLAGTADIVVAASGVPHLVKRSWIKEGAVVIDVGINRLDDGKLTGDVAFDEVKERCAAITPVPGGVGPMTVAMLISNTLELRLRRPE